MNSIIGLIGLVFQVVDWLAKHYVTLRRWHPTRKVLGHLANPRKKGVAIIKTIDADPAAPMKVDLSYAIDWSRGMPEVKSIYWGNINGKWSIGDATCLLGLKGICDSLLRSAHLDIHCEDEGALKGSDVVVCIGGNAVSHRLLRSLWPEAASLKEAPSYAHEERSPHNVLDKTYFRGVSVLLDGIRVHRQPSGEVEYGAEFAVILKRSVDGVEHILFVGNGTRATAASGRWFAEHCADIGRCYGRRDFALLLHCDTALEHLKPQLVKVYPAPNARRRRMRLFDHPGIYEEGRDHPKMEKYKQVLRGIRDSCRAVGCRGFPHEGL